MHIQDLSQSKPSELKLTWLTRLLWKPVRSLRRVSKVGGFPVKVGIIYNMPFEYDLHKSNLNRAKHGIDFDEAQALWNDDFFLEIPAKNLDEPRFLAIGKIGGKHWSAIITYRNEKIRIISVRRSRDEEIELYENESL